MGRRHKHKKKPRKRPATEMRRPSTLQRQDPAGKGEAAPTVFDPSSAKELKADGRLIARVTRARGLPENIAQAIYQAAQRLLENPHDARDFGRVATGVSAVAKVDIETGRYQEGEPANTLNVNQQVAVVNRDDTVLNQQVASMFASMLPPSAVDAHVLPQARGNGEPNHDSPSPPIHGHPEP